MGGKRFQNRISELMPGTEPFSIRLLFQNCFGKGGAHSFPLLLTNVGRMNSAALKYGESSGIRRSEMQICFATDLSELPCFCVAERGRQILCKRMSAEIYSEYSIRFRK
ncbi:hypothetical protein CDAR_226001 [Caerostris darwini]|uniref:Uncharacterized protein n=1 Tax=Caerostris darwini TaxID=1538125 RepID=A0AAV4VLC3_9ARAC|nr:hypothetical protein CDAR_226001 [Caerostris darwini]